MTAAAQVAASPLVLTVTLSEACDLATLSSAAALVSTAGSTAAVGTPALATPLGLVSQFVVSVPVLSGGNVSIAVPVAAAGLADQAGNALLLTPLSTLTLPAGIRASFALAVLVN